MVEKEQIEVETGMPTAIQMAVLSLIENAGDILHFEVARAGNYRDSAGYNTARENEVKKGDGDVKNCVFLRLVWPGNGDFSQWADFIVKAEELIDELEKEVASERALDEKFNFFEQLVNEAIEAGKHTPTVLNQK